MFYPKLVVGNKVIISDFQVLTEKFLHGEHLSLELSEHVFCNINHNSEGTYIKYVDKIKYILNNSKIDYYNELIIIESSDTIDENEKAVLIRFINLSSINNNKIVIFNRDIIFIPEGLKKFDNELLYNHVNFVFNNYLKKRKLTKIFNKIKAKKIKQFLN